MKKILEQIREFADKAHGNQMRKYSPDRYIVHPVRVMETCSKYTNHLPILAAALLHDVLEDTDTTVDDLHHFLEQLLNSEETVETLSLVVEMTDVFVKSEYPKWNRRKRKQRELERIVETSADAQTIKYADILDNSTEIAANDPDFALRYLSECLEILKSADTGNAALHRLAIDTVSREIRYLRDKMG